MLLITEVKDCHDGNVEELSRKLEALTQEFNTLKQKSSNADGANTSVDHSEDIERIDQSLNSLREQYERLDASASLNNKAEQTFDAKKQFSYELRGLVGHVLHEDGGVRCNPADLVSSVLAGFLQIREPGRIALLGLKEEEVYGDEVIVYSYTEEGKTLAEQFVSNIRLESGTSTELLKSLRSFFNQGGNPRNEEEGIWELEMQARVNRFLELFKEVAELDILSAFSLIAPNLPIL